MPKVWVAPCRASCRPTRYRAPSPRINCHTQPLPCQNTLHLVALHTLFFVQGCFVQHFKRSPPSPPVSKSPFLHDRLPLRSYSPIACNTPTRDACLRQPRPIKPAHFHIWVSRIARLLYLGAAAIGTTEHHFNSLPLSHTSGPATCLSNKIERTRSSRFDSFYSLVPPHLSATAISSSTSATTKYL